MAKNDKIPYYRPPKIIKTSSSTLGIDRTRSDIDRNEIGDMSHFPIIAHPSKIDKFDVEHDFEAMSIDFDR
jgi:hypothetical protein